MAQQSTLRLLGQEIAFLFEPLIEAFGSEDSFRELFLRLGWRVDTLPKRFSDLVVTVNGAITAVEALADEPTLSELETAFTDIRSLVSTLRTIQVPDGVGLQPAELAEALLELLITDYLSASWPRLYQVLQGLGIVTLINHREETVGLLDRPAYVQVKLDYDELVSVFQDPSQFARKVFGWGTVDFAPDRALGRAMEVFHAIGLPGVLEDVPPEVAKGYQPDPAKFREGIDRVLQLPLFLGIAKTEVVQAGFDLLAVPAEVLPDGTVSKAPAIVIQPRLPKDVGLTRQLSDTVTLTITGGTGLPELFGIVIRPGAIDLRDPFSESGSLPLVQVGVAVDVKPATPWVLLGSPTGSRLELRGLRFGVGVDAATGGASATVEVATDGLNLHLEASDGDGFVGKLLGDAVVDSTIALALRWSTKTGLSFGGAGGFEVARPLNLSLGPIQITRLQLALAGTVRNDRPAFTTSVGIDISGALGPVAVSAEAVGVELALGFRPPEGNAGAFALSAGFKPPTGAGISISAGPISGGGFLSIKDGRYAGALELKIYSVAVKAFGVIDTKLPDGSEGFSFVIVISAEFTPIQLGLGFTLLGVGGLIGINRRVDGKALEAAVRDGHLENVLFPTNVVERAPEIIRDLSALFPPTEGRYVFGPLAKIGWGTPTLIRAELGVILELPGPILSLLGEVRCALPKEEAALVRLNLSVAGQLDFAGKSFELFAALHDSEIAGYKVKGQMAMRLRWGPQPVFALAVGGFHPAYTPPPGFPALQPMSVDLGRNGNPGITLTGFFAITSNTAQVGGALALRASGSGVRLEATLSVKAIFVFSPFSFEAEIDAQVRVSFHGYGIGVRLHGMLSGPSPWRIAGSVCVSVLWWDACLSFDKSFGGGERVELPTIDPFDGIEPDATHEEIPGLEDAVSDPRSWEPVAPVGVLSVVSLAQGAGEIPPFDPMGGLSMRQKVVPLETREKIARFGVAKAKNPRVFTLTAATVGTGGTLQRGADDLKENFAPAQFFEMDATHKLSAPSFVEQVAGYTFTVDPNDAQVGSVDGRDLEYDTIVRDTRPDPPATTIPTYHLPDGHLVGMLKRSAKGLFGVAQLGDLRYIDPLRPDRFKYQTPKYVPASKVTLEGLDLFAAGNKLEAVLSIEAHVRAKPADLDTVQVVPEQEVFKAA